MTITIDLEYIKEKAIEREKENWEFRAFLKQHDLALHEIDAIVHKINDEVSIQIDCTNCANCCKQIRPVLDKDDISKFALGLKIPVREFQKQYLRQVDETSSKRQFNKLPCPFLKNDECTIYDFRPKDCRSYPHLHKRSFVTRLWGVIENYEICPIVFNVYEQLKNELWQNDWVDYDFDLEWM
jgi:Fe-S-cluster containining protein